MTSVRDGLKGEIRSGLDALRSKDSLEKECKEKVDELIKMMV